MKTLSKSLLIIISLGLMFTACKKEEDGIPTKDPKFSKLSPEENKSNIEQAGVEFMNELEDLTKSDAITAAESMSTKMNNQKSVVIKSGFLPTLLSLKDGNPTSEVKSLLAESPLRDEIEAEAAIYTWNFNTEEFDSSGTDELQVKFLFPYDENSVNNDCELTLSVELTTVNDAYLETSEAPSNVTATLMVKDVKVVEYVFAAEYNTDGLPSKIESSFQVDTYKWKHTLAQSTSAASYDYLFTHGDKTLMNTGMDVDGNFDISEVEAYIEKLDTIQEYEQGIISEAGTFVKEVKMYYQIMNIKLINLVNTTNMAIAADDIIDKEESGEYTEEQAQDAGIAALNTHIHMYLMYADDFRKIADAEIYLKTVDYEEYNYETNSTEIVEREEPAVQFIFEEDGSPVDAEAYFQEGFDNFEEEIINMETELEDLFASF
ncbi:MAG: hypothetical protein PF481_00770 [Bacteroidales bacterium]|jgi:hypothetical protein|nr:hypothetical protein [Bacteroidales bacterium]